MSGPLNGVKIIELAGIGPGPMCAMALADLGATVLRIDRVDSSHLGIERPLRYDLLLRNRHSITLNLKDTASVEFVLRLLETTDVLIEGFRPGVTERLGLGPAVCMAKNQKLVYGRITGWGQTGPLALSAGHDINYLALTGILNAVGREGHGPTIPLNLLGDYAGGAMYLAMGILAAIIESRTSGQGQVVDAAIVDGATHLATSFFGLYAAGAWGDVRGTNVLDGGAFFYDVYQCDDGLWISIGPIEKKFLTELVKVLELDEALIGDRANKDRWEDARQALAGVFRTRSRDEWCARLEGTDACFAPVLDWAEAGSHPHLLARQTLINVSGVIQPAPAPRFSRSVPDRPRSPKPTNDDLMAALAPWLTAAEINQALAVGTIGQRPSE